MIAAVTSALTTVIQWIGTVVTSLVGDTGGLSDLLPLFAIGIAVAVVRMAIRSVRDITWGA